MTDAPKPSDRFSDENIVLKLTPHDLEEAKRLLSLLATDASDARVEPRAGQRANAHVLERRARDVLANRKRRHDIFGKGMFGEPAWEMLLLLYVMQGGARQTISRLGEGAGVSKSTALRWIDYLEARRLIRRESHPTDRRAAFVELTDKGRDALELYLFETLPT